MSQVYGDFELKDRMYLHGCVVDPAPLHFNGEINARKETVSFAHVFDSTFSVMTMRLINLFVDGSCEITDLP